MYREEVIMQSSQIKLGYCGNSNGLGIEQTPPATEEERPSVIPPPVIPPPDHAQRNPLDEGGTADYSTTIRIAQDEGIGQNSSSKRHITKLKLNLSDGRIVRLNADNNNLLSDDKTMFQDCISFETVKLEELKNYVIIFNINVPMLQVPMLYKKEDLYKLNNNPFSKQAFTDVFEVKVEVQDNTNGILDLTLTKKSYSEFKKQEQVGVTSHICMFIAVASLVGFGVLLIILQEE
tara:strand:+ start:1272 stop:1973 length:702 start_codon:yes stop_codon:yes gene_type:complete